MIFSFFLLCGFVYSNDNTRPFDFSNPMDEIIQLLNEINNEIYFISHYLENPDDWLGSGLSYRKYFNCT